MSKLDGTLHGPGKHGGRIPFRGGATLEAWQKLSDGTKLKLNNFLQSGSLGEKVLSLKGGCRDVCVFGPSGRPLKRSTDLLPP
jgi:hypothetical protein